ncbi:hypothetical protein CBS9595_002569 [Malassezia furfur]|nr:hypothetical protein CBS9595_002569 [Malassezia furfur]
MSATVEDPLSLSLDLLRRLPPANVTKNVQHLINMLPDHADDLASSVDQPLTLRIDQSKEGAGREFLCCDYNRDGESWRSWISNTWVPPLKDGDEESAPVPTGKLRELELHANDAFETYRKLYYETGYTSTYLWDLGADSPGDVPANFAGVVLFKKDLEGSADDTAKGTFGSWDSIHVFEVATVPSSGSAGSATTVKSAKYKLSSTVMLTLNRHDGDAIARKNVDLSGSLSRQTEETMKVTDVTNHIINLGRIIEDVESKIRNQLQEIYFGKTHDIVEQLRSLEDLEASRNAKKLQEELVAGWER